MSFLLKIVEGPMKGAEIALVEGLRVKVGSGDVCDIVIADGSLPAVAFELDVAPEAVSLIVGSETQTLRPFEVVAFGTTEIAIGPSEGPWKPLARPVPAEKPEAVDPPAAPVEHSRVESPVREPSDPEPAERREGTGCLAGIIILILLLLFACGSVWWVWLCAVKSFPWILGLRDVVVETAVRGLCGEERPATVCEEPMLSLDEIARIHGLVLDKTGEIPVLKGNVARRTERLAIRALAFAGDREVRFDLTDDETLRTASDELLFVVTEGRLKATVASNRVVTLVGYAPTSADLEKTIRALNQDVKGIDRLVTRDVRVGGPPPNAGAGPATAVSVPAVKTARGVKTNPARDFPIAGILTVPYPCVVLRNGMRVTEGAQIGGSTLEKIETGRLVLRNGATTFEWKP